MEDYELHFYIKGEVTRKQIGKYIRDLVLAKGHNNVEKWAGGEFNWTVEIGDWELSTSVDQFSSGYTFRTSSSLTRKDYKHEDSYSVAALRAELTHLDFLESLGIELTVWPARTQVALESSAEKMLKLNSIVEDSIPELVASLGIDD